MHKNQPPVKNCKVCKKTLYGVKSGKHVGNKCFIAQSGPDKIELLKMMNPRD